MVADERDDFLTDVVAVHALHPASMQRMSAAIAERIGMVRTDAERLDPAGVDEVADGADQTLPLVFLFVSAAGREHDHRWAPVTQHDDAHVALEPIGIPFMYVTSHNSPTDTIHAD